jgi:hypothetical protein
MSGGTALTGKYFANLHALPCWNSFGEYGTWLSLYFGRPRVVVHEALKRSRLKRLRRRRAYVSGEFLLWVEMGSWEYSDRDGSRIKPSSRKTIRHAAKLLCGQSLRRVVVKPRAVETIFRFDYGTLRVWPYRDLQPDDPLWHLYTPKRVLTLRRDGMLSHGLSNGKQRLIRSNTCSYDV